MKKLIALLIFTALCFSVNSLSYSAGITTSFYSIDKNQGDLPSGMMSNLIDRSRTLNVWGPFGHHKGRYCLIQRLICFPRLDVTDNGLPENGMATVSIEYDPLGLAGALHFSFSNYAYPVNGHMGVDTNVLLNSDVAAALGYKEIILHGGDYPLDTSINQFGEVTIPASFVNSGEAAVGSPFGRHKCTREAHYCLCSGGICWKDIFRLDDVSFEIPEYGWWAMTPVAAENIGRNGGTLKFRFLNNPQDSNGILAVDTIIFDREISNELGYDSVVVLGDDYIVNYSGNQYGEIYVKAEFYNPVTSLQLKLIPEGFITLNGTASISDTSKVYLRSSSAPYMIVDSAKTVINKITLTGNCYFSNAVSGNYYIDVKHRNSIETWSSVPVTISPAPNSYDFTTEAAKAYGNNEISKFGYWCTYSGDVNQNGFINLEDVIIINNASALFSSGYIPSDVNGDYSADLQDLLIAYNNSINFVTRIIP